MRPKKILHSPYHFAIFDANNNYIKRELTKNNVQ